MRRVQPNRLQNLEIAFIGIPLKIVHYPHPTLRYKSKPVQRVDANLRSIAREMFDLMYEAKGVGLACNQVDLPFRMFVMNLESEPNSGEEQIIVNPVLSRPSGNEEKEEGCLSLPGIYAPVVRPGKIRLHAYTLTGEEIDQVLSGLMARVVQHETDHLDGVLFIDRLTPTAKIEIEEAVDQFTVEYESRSERPTDDQIAQRLRQLEQDYC